MTDLITLHKDGRTKTVSDKTEAEKCISKGWTPVEEIHNFQVGFSRSAMGKLASANLKPWQAFNEFIANSIDSWIDFPANPRPKLVVDIDIQQKADLSKSKILIVDNAVGMDFEGQAVLHGRPAGR